MKVSQAQKESRIEVARRNRTRRTKAQSALRRRLVVLALLGCIRPPSIARAALNVWTSNGPNSPINALAIDPTNPATVYAGRGFVGPGNPPTLFKSTDGGVTWDTSVVRGIPPANDILNLTVDPAMPNRLYIGTDAFLYVSLDGGMSATAAAGPSIVHALVIDPSTPNTYYVGDNGVQRIVNGMGGLPIRDDLAVNVLAIDPRTPSTLYMGTEFTGVLESTDSGMTWNPIGLDGLSGVDSLVISPTNRATLYATVRTVAGSGGGVYSNRLGLPYFQMWNAGLPDPPSVVTLAIDPLTPRIVYVGSWTYDGHGLGVFRSDDGAASWSALNDGLTNTNVHALAISPRPPIVVYAGTDSGVFVLQASPPPATFAVNSTADAHDAAPDDHICATTDGACTLRAAVESARSGDTITVPAGTYTLSLGALDIAFACTVHGADARTTVIDAGFMRIEDAMVGLSGVTVRNGGGIENNGVLTLTNFTVSENSSTRDASGGGIRNYGTLTLINGAISDNSINSFYAGFGGGLINFGDASLTDVSINGNSAMSSHPGGEGGGIYNSGTLTLTNVTIANNTAGGNGGDGAGIYNAGTLTLTNVTIANNSAPYGGALSNQGTAILKNVTIAGNGTGGGSGAGGISNNQFNGPLTLKDTIVANSTAGPNCSGGGITSLDYNLDSDGTCGLNGPHDLTTVDPKLWALQDNGGPTLTIALLPGSPGIDSGGADCPATDQRGVSRPQGAACDIGAYEADGTVSVACVGDCRAIDAVQITDILTLVNIALGNAQASTCAHGVASSTDVTVALIIQAVNNALNGCAVGSTSPKPAQHTRAG